MVEDERSPWGSFGDRGWAGSSVPRAVAPCL